jgi:pimeloyl-ACP methyl ester carboxylesterase
MSVKRHVPAAVAISPAPPRGILGIRSLPLLKAAIRHLPEIVLRRPLMPTRREVAELEFNRIPVEGFDELYAELVPESGRQIFDQAVKGFSVDHKQVTTPLLVVAGEDDRLNPPAMIQRVARRYGADLFMYPNHAHMIMLEPGWERPAADIITWLSTTLR